ncbi:type II toxin-antitoxin system RelE/ParE family toxin [Thiorhodovibrio frisius]|nr:type II toxin-antitoxin system RelE/ParE family toxin [Thiorhodovibrio frisius]
MELFWTPQAIRDRDDIYDYIEADSPAAALALDELFSKKHEYSQSYA